jgi:MFS family permease
MSRRSEIAAVYAAGIVQGLALVTFPAASVVFTRADGYDLSSTEYGAMFLPQALTAIAASLLGASLNRLLGLKRIFLLGLAANLLSMVLLLASQFLTADHSLAYGFLVAATASLGIGFGLTVPAVNTLAAGFFPQQVDSAILVLNALLGLGTALAPIMAALFVGLGVWWGLPILVGVLVLGLWVFSLRLLLTIGPASGDGPAQQGAKLVPARFWLFAGFALLYGVVETVNGNWATLYMTQDLGASPALASVALTVFWGAVTGGRVLFAAIEKWCPERSTYRFLPFVVAGAFVVLGCLPKNASALGIVAFGLAGLGCSALLPLTISFGQKALPTIATSVAGGLVAFYQMGYGIAAFGVGPLRQLAGLELNIIVGGMAVIALLMAVLSLVVAGGVDVPTPQVSSNSLQKHQGVPT